MVDLTHHGSSRVMSIIAHAHTRKEDIASRVRPVMREELLARALTLRSPILLKVQMDFAATALVLTRKPGPV